MITFLDHLDKQWLLALNNDYAPFWDGVMYGFSARLTWLPLYLSLLVVIFRRWRQQGWWLVVGLLLCVAVADQVASGLLKEAVQRWRPSHAPDLEGLVVLVRDYRGGPYGFVSSHASNSFGLALLTSLLFRRKAYTWSIFAWAMVNAYSRIYLGVHYPGDILGGAVVGLLSAWMVYALLRKCRPQLFADDENRLGTAETRIPVAVLGISAVCLPLYSLCCFV